MGLRECSSLFGSCPSRKSVLKLISPIWYLFKVSLYLHHPISCVKLHNRLFGSRRPKMTSAYMWLVSVSHGNSSPRSIPLSRPGWSGPASLCLQVDRSCLRSVCPCDRQPARCNCLALRGRDVCRPSPPIKAPLGSTGLIRFLHAFFSSFMLTYKAIFSINIWYEVCAEKETPCFNLVSENSLRNPSYFLGSRIFRSWVLVREKYAYYQFATFS